MGNGAKPTLLGWIVFLFALFLINRTKDGHIIIFYVLVLVLVLLLAGNSSRIMPKLIQPS